MSNEPVLESRLDRKKEDTKEQVKQGILSEKWKPNYLKLADREKELYEQDPLTMGIEAITNLP